MSSVYLRLLIFLPAILIPACGSSSLAFYMIYSACKLNRQSDKIHLWCTPFPTWNQSVVPCPVLTVAYWPANRFLWRHVRWSDVPTSWRIFQFVLIHIVKGYCVVNITEIDIFLKFSCFFVVPLDVGNLISGSSAFSKSSLNIWKFTVHVLLKPGLDNFEPYFASVGGECNWVIVWTFLTLPFTGIGMKTDLFQSCSHCWVFQVCWHIECGTFTASSFRNWNSSTGIPSPPLHCL